MLFTTPDCFQKLLHKILCFWVRVLALPGHFQVIDRVHVLIIEEKW